MTVRLLLAAGLLWPTLAAAETTVDDVQACMRRNTPARATIPSLSLQMLDRSGEAVEASAQVSWRSDDRGTRIVLRMAEPEDVRGTSLLIVEGDGEPSQLFLYLPEMSKARRVRKRQLDRPLLGTDFSFDDFTQIRRTAGRGRVTLVGVREIHERPVWLLEVQPPEDARSTYAELRIYVDQESCLPLRTEFVAGDGDVRKVLTAALDSITREGDHYVPRAFLMRDLRDGTETRIAIDEIRIDEALEASGFTVGALAGGD